MKYLFNLWSIVQLPHLRAKDETPQNGLNRATFLCLEIVSTLVSDYGEDKKKKEEKKEDVTKSQEEKRKHIKTLIGKIPTEKSALFAYQLDWAAVDNVSVNTVIGYYFEVQTKLILRINF